MGFKKEGQASAPYAVDRLNSEAKGGHSLPT